MNAKIAVVIPFYKREFFEELLAALATQTCLDFNVYVGNDASDPIGEEMCNRYAETLDITYRRFPERLGDKDLAGQWNRCVRLTKDEEWIWVVPDDDLPSENAIEQILNSVAIADQLNVDVLHLPCVIIDGNNRLLSPDATASTQEFATMENSGEFILRELKNQLAGLTLANAIYRKEALLDTGMFVSYPRGCGSDHATMLSVSRGGKILTVQDTHLKFRMSGVNISSKVHDGDEKLDAKLQMAEWIKNTGDHWYGAEIKNEILRRFYFRAEYFVVKIWPSSTGMLLKLFRLGVICGCPRSFFQKLSISVKAALLARDKLNGN